MIDYKEIDKKELVKQIKAESKPKKTRKRKDGTSPHAKRVKPVSYNAVLSTDYVVHWYTAETVLKNVVADEIENAHIAVLGSSKEKQKKFLNIGAGFDCETSEYGINGKNAQAPARPQPNATPQEKAMYLQAYREYKDAIKSFVWIWQFSFGHHVFLCSEFKLFERFILELDSIVYSIGQDVQLIVWDANLNFEYSFFKPLLEEHITDIFARSKSDILSISVGNVVLRECLGVFGNSLAKVAKNYTKTQKLVGDLDYDKIRIPAVTPITEEELQYCINDVVILSELSYVAHDMYTRNGMMIPMTQTGIVRNAITKAYAPCKKIKEMIYEHNKKLIGDELEYENFRAMLYSGGLTHSNYKYVGKKIGKCEGSDYPDAEVLAYDLTSAYPWALSSFSYPAGELVHNTYLVNTYSSEEVLEMLGSGETYPHWIVLMRFKDVESYTGHSTVSKDKCTYHNAVIDNGRIASAEYMEIWLNEIDYMNFNAIYDYAEYEVLDLYGFTKSSRVPANILAVMYDWYKKKTILKPLTKEEHKNDKDYEDNCKEYVRLKQLINSIYGMFVTKLYKRSLSWNSKQKDIEENVENWDEYNNTLFNPWWGYYCTSFVRNRLIQMIHVFPDNIIQYDTDSIYVIINNEEEKQKIQEAVDFINADIYETVVQNVNIKECWDLGQWDVDGYYPNGFICLGSKRYAGIHEDGSVKITFAGANKDDLKEQAEKNKIFILDYLKNIEICEEESNKKGAYHFEEEYNANVTDFLGNTQRVTTYGGTTIKNVQFKAHLSKCFEELQKFKETHENLKELRIEKGDSND